MEKYNKKYALLKAYFYNFIKKPYKNRHILLNCTFFV